MEPKKKNSNMNSRPPIVTVLGHVDHGKTTLLDKIRNTAVASREAGGITQGIGASVVMTKNGKTITFIDTPGHAAFSNMRSRGAKIADIAILVISATDGVMPQTKEALEYILQANLPYIVAANKIDLPSADIEIVKSALEKEGVLIEGSGGDIPVIPISGKTGQGLDELLEMLILMTELHEISGTKDDPTESFVIESGKDKRGSFASVVVKNGCIAVGDDLVSEDGEMKVRGIFDYQAKNINEIVPGYPGQIIGFAKTPSVGSRLWKKNEKGAVVAKVSAKSMIAKLNEGEVGVFIKAQNAGSLEAVLANLPKKAIIMGSGVGDVTDSDIFMAKSTGADVYAFDSKTPSLVAKLADTEGVKIFEYKIIYELFEDIQKKIDGGAKIELGRAEIVASFPFDNKKVAGSKVVSGKITKNDKLILMRGDKEIGKVKVISLKKNKIDVPEVRQGEEFGIIFVPQLDFTIGDVIISLQ